MAFNIGDVVYVKPHINIEIEGCEQWHNIPWTSHMAMLEGQIVIVQQIDGERYLVKPRHVSFGYMGGTLVWSQDIEAWFAEDSLELCKPKFANGTKVLVRKHSKDEKDQYSSTCSILWSICMDGFEGNIGTVEGFRMNGHNYVYRVSMNGDECRFGEDSLIDAEYSIF